MEAIIYKKVIIIFCIISLIALNSISSCYLIHYININKTQDEKITNLQEHNESLSKEIRTLNSKINSLNNTITLSGGAAATTTTPSSSGNPSASEPSSGKTAYLTFDDGPSSNTPKIINILKQNNITATFFVCGHTEYSSYYKLILDEGSVIGNHTYSHDYKLIYSSLDGFKKDVNKLNIFLGNLGIQKPTLIRFPGGSNNTVSNLYGGKSVMSSIINETLAEGYNYTDWNVSGEDAEKKPLNKDAIVRNVINGSKNKSSIIILLHDLNPKVTSVEALPEIITTLKSYGFTFKSITNNSQVIHFR